MAALTYRRRVHILLSAMWGAGLIVGTGVQLAIIFATSVDVANALASAFSLATTGVLMTATFIVGKRARARWDERNEPVLGTAEQITDPKG